MRRIFRHADKMVLALALVLLLASAVWASISFRRVDAIAALGPAGAELAAHYESHLVRMPAIASITWPEPPAQSRGRDWVYDVFTPPVIWYDREQKTFTVKRPEITTPVVEVAEVPFEVELVAVRQEPYRIQLVGYAVKDADLIAHLEIAELNRVVLGRAGEVFPPGKGDFTVRSFDVRRITTNSSGSMPVVESVGIATILDGRTGREVTLTTRERLMLPRLQCVLRSRGYPPDEFTVREGGKITVNGFDYLVTRLSLNPAEAVVSRQAPGSIGSAEIRTLEPVGATPGPAAPAGP